MKTIKQILLTMAVLLFSLTANAYDFEIDGIYYNIISIEDLTVEVTSGNNKYSGEVIIPSSITFQTKTLTVTAIGSSAFSDCSSLASITIPNTVTEIGYRAFYNCSALESITIPNSVTSIKNATFDNCSSLKELYMEDGNTTLGLGCNYYYGNYTLGEGLFYDCPLETLYLGRNLDYNDDITYGYSPFYNRIKLKSLTISNSVTQMGNCAFYGCSSLTSIAIPNTITEIGYSAFYGCSSLASIAIPNTVTIIEGKTFVGCSSLASITIPNTVTEIGYSAFSGCSALESITIPSSVTSIENAAFNNCSSLSEVYIEDSEKSLSMGYNRRSDDTYLDLVGEGLFYDCPLKILYLGRNLFYDHYYVYGHSPFYNKTELESLTIGCQVTNLSNAIEGCNSLLKIDLKSPFPPGCDTEFSSAQYMYTEVDVPADCLSVYQETTPWKNFWNLSGRNDLISLFEIDGIKYLEVGNGNLSIIGNSISESKEFYINNNIEYYGNTYSVVSISDAAFKECSYLLSLHIPSTIQEIGDYAFKDCYNIKNITVNSPSSLQKIGNSAFVNCDKLETINLPSTIQEIGDYAFEYCSNIKNITVNSPSSLQKIGDYAFASCEKLETINLPSSLQEIGSAAFQYCSLLDNVILPNSITAIPSCCFYKCKSLSSMVIPSSVIKFEEKAFFGCSGLKELVFEDGEKPLIFPNGEYDGATGYINVMDGANLYCVINYYDSYFSDLPVEKLYIGRNLANESRYTISDRLYGDGRYYYRVSSYDAPFSKFSKLKELTIGENVDILGPEQEYISEVNMYITSGSFKNCSSIQTIEVKNSTPPAGAEFANNVYSNAKLIVPKSSINLYEEAEPWKNFVNLMKFNITYIVDNDVYFIDTIATGDTIVLIDEPTKEGHTFSGWSEAPETMPAEDIEITGSFSVNTYAITYIVNGEVYATDSLTYGSEIVLIDEPTKEGHTFSWSESPETMPAYDVEITGSFSVNTYAITYMVDGEVYATDILTYGSEIVLIDEPTKEGHTFSGWSEAPETMPAEDITITGSFSVNTYAITYIVDGEVYATDSLTYGSKIILPEVLTKEGYTFSWSEAPETMPAEDITITGSFSVNTYAITYIVDGEVYATDSLAYGSEIVLIDEPTKEGYTFSGWSEAPETMPAEDITITGSFIPTENVSEVEFDANIQTTNNGIILLNANNNWVRVYTINGILVKKIDNYTGEEITLNKGVYIVSVGNKAIKIML